MNRFIRRNWLFAVVGIAAGLATSGSWAQASDYPNRPIRLIVPFAAGGAIDATARPIADAVGRELGQQVVVENRPGAGGNIGAALVARSAADGYTLLVGTSATHGANSALSSSPGYDPIADFEPLTFLGAVPNVLVVNAEHGPGSLEALVSDARRNPGKLTYGSAGPGTPMHVGGVQFERAAKVDLVHVPYKGGAPAAVDLMGNNITMMFVGVSVVLPNISAGKLRAFAVAAPQRHFALPDVPTFAELGMPSVDASAWAGAFAPRGTPAPVVQKLNAAFSRALQDKAVMDALRANGVQIRPMQGETFRSFVASEVERWGQVIRETKVAAG